MMLGITTDSIARAIQAPYFGDSTTISGVAIDSRELQKGELYVALRGQRADGHVFLEDVAAKGAAAAIVEARNPELALAQIEVADSQIALGKAAAHNRSQFHGQVVAITGSAGKTSCKNMLAAILSQLGTVCATRGNFNNEIGLPLTLSRLSDTDTYAVLEMGAAKTGDIAYLTELARPDISVITNVAEAHLGGFGSLDNTAAAKAEIYQSLREGGLAVINRDDDYFDYWVKLVEARPGVRWIDFSMSASDAAVFASAVNNSPEGMVFDATVTLSGSTQTFSVTLPLLGEHNVANALPAIAIAMVLGAKPSQVQFALGSVEAEAGRLQVLKGRNGLQLIDDSYNSNPTAAAASLEVLAGTLLENTMPISNSTVADESTITGRQTVAVLGEMGELGDGSADLHWQLGATAAQLGIEHLFAVGESAEHVVAGYSSQGHADQLRAQAFSELGAIADRLLEDRFRNAVVLVKGSRFMQLDQLVDLLVLKDEIELNPSEGDK